eukprot:RCo028002
MSQPGKPFLSQPVKFTAVILADTFTHDFRPISDNCPRALMPVVNVPMLDYTLEFLTSNGFDELVLFTSSHSRAIQDHIQASRWANSEEVSVRVLISKCTTPGDALRHVHDVDVIRQDFVLVPGDLMTNFSKLKDVLRKHIERRQADPSILMTLVLKECPLAPGQAQKSVNCGEERVTAVIDPSTGHLLHYKPWFSTSFGSREHSERAVVLSQKLLKDRESVQCRSDLVDTNIVVCAPELLGLFKENFDFFDLKHDCVRGILEEELRGSKVVVDLIQVPFLERVCSPSHYARISHAVLNRWLYPMVPDHHWRGPRSRGSDRCVAANPTTSVYVCTSAQLAHDVRSGPNVAIGSRTVVSGGVQLTGCVIGANCRIGRNTQIVNSVVWDNVEIGPDCVLESCIVCADVEIGSGAHISPGTILSFKVKVGDGHHTSPDSRIQVPQMGQPSNPAAVGAGGYGVLWLAPWEEQDDGSKSTSDFEWTPGPKAHRGLKEAIAAANAKFADEALCDDLLCFHEELIDTLHRAYENDHRVDDCILEIMGLKLGFDRSFEDCVRGIVWGTLVYIDDKTTPKEYREQLTSLLSKKWAPVVQRFLTSPATQKVALTVLQEVTAERKALEASFGYVMKLFYDRNFLEEEVILEWASFAEKGTERDKLLLQKCEKFIQWLKEADEEGDSD